MKMKSESKQGIISIDGTDAASKSKRIRFDEDGEIETHKKSKLLLESDGDDEEFVFPEYSESKSKSRAKLAKLQSSIGNDQRFAVDERFLEDEDIEESQSREEEEIDEYSDEKRQQLEILGSILGKPLSAKKDQTEKDNKTKSLERMIRYDPTDEHHQEYEILPEKKEKVKNKKKKEIEIVEKSELPAVSQEYSYSIADSKSLKVVEGEQFSFLKAFGRESIESDKEKVEPSYKSDSKNKTFGFDSSKAFKYDSSDEEEEVNENLHKAKSKSKSENVQSSNFAGNTDRFLFVIDDPRFQECEEFFKNRSEGSEDLKTLRPKLKQTIRKRIRTNLKKNSARHKRMKKKF